MYEKIKVRRWRALELNDCNFWQVRKDLFKKDIRIWAKTWNRSNSPIPLHILHFSLLCWKRSLFEQRPEIDPAIPFHYIFCISVFCVFFFLKVLIKMYNYIFFPYFVYFLPLCCKVNGNRIIFVLFTIIFPVYNTVLMQKLLIYMYSVNKWSCLLLLNQISETRVTPECNLSC